MSENFLEQHPLLCEEASEEDLSPRYYRRIRSMNCRGRAKIKGAAAVIASWPDHWSSFITYWWVGIGMISLSTLIIYNSLFALTMLPTANFKFVSSILAKKNETPPFTNVLLPDIYMHVFIEQHEDIDLNQYMPYIDTLSNTFFNYTFNFIVIINDTNADWMTAEENNELALNMILDTNKSVFDKESSNSNVNIKHITLSAYMANSPLKKFWRMLPHQLIEFLARTISIWEKGGVAFNPDILTPKFQHTLYIQKLQTLLNKYSHTKFVIDHSQFMKKQHKSPKKYKKLNNIRDIIDALENDDVINTFSEQSLSEAENKDAILFTNRAWPLRHNIVLNTMSENSQHNKNLNSNSYSINVTKPLAESTHANDTETTLNISQNSTKTLLPLFFNFLFHNNANEKLQPKVTSNNYDSPKQNADVTMHSKKGFSMASVDLQTKSITTGVSYNPLIVSVKNTNTEPMIEPTTTKTTEGDIEANRLTIDLKGNIIGTDTPCHAFLGTIFSHVVHHREEETITDFIIAELTIFCKGLLSSCTGIDLILL